MDLNKWLNQTEDAATEQIAEGLKGGLNEGFEDGTYIGFVKRNKFQESGSGKPGILTIFTILESDDPAKIGEDYLVWNDLEREDGFKFATWFLKSMKCPIVDPSELVAEMRKNVKREKDGEENDLFDLAANKIVAKFMLTTTVSKNNGNSYQNLKVKNVIEEYDFDSVPTADNGGGTEEIPDDQQIAEEDGGDSGPTPQVGMKIKFLVTEGKGKNAQEVEKSGEITELDEVNELIKVKEEDGTMHEIEPTKVTGMVEETAVE